MINIKASNSIFLSIKPKFIDLITNKEKTFEFRSKIPKKLPNYFIVYTSIRKKIEFILEVKKPIKYPNTIEENWIWNKEFNLWLKKSNYAYEIVSIFKLKKSLNLEYLKNKYNFTAPQSFIYWDKYKDLVNEIRDLL